MSLNGSTPFTVFTETQYLADPKSVVAHAVATGRAIVARSDGTAWSSRFRRRNPPSPS